MNQSHRVDISHKRPIEINDFDPSQWGRNMAETDFISPKNMLLQDPSFG